MQQLPTGDIPHGPSVPLTSEGGCLVQARLAQAVGGKTSALHQRTPLQLNHKLDRPKTQDIGTRSRGRSFPCKPRAPSLAGEARLRRTPMRLTHATTALLFAFAS